ncbi:hypothetical protein MNV49_001774 [Pseudohyphozyma bogoriensis]|nr:hypothetical protein MNV49_001774 [Pseudohyphozyma bogoriensis]
MSPASSATDGFPHPKPMLSYWLANMRASPLLGYRSSEQLPKEAELVIVGSGMSGVATAYHILTAENSPYAGRPGSIVMLEAREICSGATGRNGGHCRPDTYLGYPTYKADHGIRDGLALIDLELDNLNYLASLVEKEGIQCDFWRGDGESQGGMDVFMTEEILDEARAALKEYKEDGGKIETKWIEDKAEAAKAARIPGAIGAATYPAGQLYPFKVVQHLLLKSLSLGLKFYSSTPVTSVSSGSAPYTITTPNGPITAPKILYATNAYTGKLLPELKEHFTPVLGHCSAATPTEKFSGKGLMKFTQCIRWGRDPDHPEAQHEKFEYMIQRPSDGTIIIGGGHENNDFNDSKTKEPEANYLRTYNQKTYADWGEEKGGEGTNRVWTGIMGNTYDYLPFVGPIPGRPGQYVFAGHNGYGLAKLMLAGPGADYSVSGLPAPLACTVERLKKKAKKSHL